MTAFFLSRITVANLTTSEEIRYALKP